jgi:hypothetical protein
VSSPSPEDKNRSVSETFCFSVSRISGDGRNPKNPVILIVIHHRQNPLESTSSTRVDDYDIDDDNDNDIFSVPLISMSRSLVHFKVIFHNNNNNNNNSLIIPIY